MLDIPGYDVAALVERSGKSASHIYARLSLLQLIPAVAEGVDPGTHHRKPCQPDRSSAGGRPGRSLRAVLAQGLAGQGTPPATGQAPCRMDTEPTSTWLSRMLRSTAKTPPSTPPPELASLALAAADTTPHCFASAGADQCLDSPATTARLRPYRPRDRSPSRPRPDRERLAQSDGATTRSRPARPRSGDRNHDRQPRRRAVMPCPPPRPQSWSTASASAQADSLHRQRIARCMTPSRSAKQRANPAPTMRTRARSRDGGRGRRASARVRAAQSGVRGRAAAQGRGTQAANSSGNKRRLRPSATAEPR